MRLPYLQLADRFIAVQSKVVARVLGCSRHEAIGLGTDLFAFAVDFTSSDEEPPSGLIVGDDAAEIIEAGMDWAGDRGKAVGAFVRADVIERLENGLRVKGCDRYQTAWQKQRLAREFATDPALSEARKEAGRKGGLAKASKRLAKSWQNVAQDGDGDGDVEKELPPPPAAVAPKPELAPPPEAFEPDEVGLYQPTAWGFWGWHNKERQEFGMFPEARPPDDLPAWYATASGELGPEGLSVAYRAYLADPEFQTDRGKPFAVFRSPSVYQPRASAKKPRKAWR